MTILARVRWRVSPYGIANPAESWDDPEYADATAHEGDLVGFTTVNGRPAGVIASNRAFLTVDLAALRFDP